MSTSTSKRITFDSFNNYGEATFTTVGMQMYDDMPVKLIRAKTQPQNTALFRKALFRAHTAKYRIDQNAEVVKDPIRGIILTSGIISVRFTVKGITCYERIPELEHVPSSSLGMYFSACKEDKDLYDKAFPVCMYMNNLLRCQIMFRCNMEITGYGSDELLTSDR